MREAQQRGQQVLRCGSARGRSADRPQSELGSCRTARPARAPRGGLPRTDAIPDPTDRPHSAAHAPYLDRGLGIHRLCCSIIGSTREPSRVRRERHPGMRPPCVT
jgi:hypothetical protein